MIETRVTETCTDSEQNVRTKRGLHAHATIVGNKKATAKRVDRQKDKETRNRKLCK